MRFWQFCIRRQHEFEASEENGWLTHGAIAARALDWNLDLFLSAASVLQNRLLCPTCTV